MSKRMKVLMGVWMAFVVVGITSLCYHVANLRERVVLDWMTSQRNDMVIVNEMNHRTNHLAEVDNSFSEFDSVMVQNFDHVAREMGHLNADLSDMRWSMIELHNNQADAIVQMGQDMEDRLPRLIAEKRPSVVSIHVEHAWKMNPHTGEPLTKVGSGVVISEHGVILTAAHMVDDYNAKDYARFWVIFEDGTERDIKKIAFVDGESPDIGVIWIDSDGLDLHPVSLVWDNDVIEGEQVLVLGNPEGLSWSASTGIVSYVDRLYAYPAEDERLHLQIDAPINGGNSGGPVFDLDGNMIGIISWGYVGSDGLNFAVPMCDVARGLAKICVPIDISIEGGR